MINNYLSDRILKEIGFEPTDCQKEMAIKLSGFITSDSENQVFLLKGYAGTGKTTAISALVKLLDDLKIKSVLLAPTGRASKVLSQYSGKQASTIHKKIYRQKSGADLEGKFSLDRNLHRDTIFIVDEASMISNHSQELSVFGSGHLLSDLIEYVITGENCKLIISGDTAQLPPVGLSISPALDQEELQYFNLNVTTCELTEVVRQSNDSGILVNATYLRNLLSNEKFNGYWKINYSGFKDVIRLSGADLIDEISNCYDKFGIDDTIIITRSNKRANKFNEGIRRTILYREDQISTGDLLMVVKNNYFWAKQSESEEFNFIANGDIAKVVKIRKFEERYGFNFVTVTLSFIDYKDITIDCKIILDALMIDAPAMTSTDNKKLYEAISEDYPEIRNKRQRWEKIRENEYFNALQVKFSYAVTCHKAQGGQWRTAFIDHGYMTEEMIDREFIRWAYTAFTRPTERLYLVNFNKEFFNLEVLG
jgi:exodeoxyribonuclease V